MAVRSASRAKAAPARRGAAKKAAPAKAGKKGLSSDTFKPVTRKGLHESSMKSGGSAAWGDRTQINEKNPFVTVQFMANPDGFREYKVHSWPEGRSWKSVPCTGPKTCPKCHDQDDEVAYAKYRFCAPVYNLGTKKAEVLDGPKDIATRVFARWKGKKDLFLKRTFEITRYPTSPVTYDVQRGDDDPVSLRNITAIDLDEYIAKLLTDHYGDEVPEMSLEADEDDIDEDEDDDLDEDDDADEDDDDDDDDEDEDEDEDEDDDDDDEDEDEDEDDEDDEDEDDEDEDDDPPPTRTKSRAKPPAKKAAAKKTAAPKKSSTAKPAARRR